MLKIKYFLFIILISLGSSKTSFAFQDLNIRETQEQLNKMISTIDHNRDKNKNIKGSPYINDVFQVVKLKRFGDKSFTGRYDANLGEMQIKRENDTIALNNTENFEITFVLSDKTYKTQSYLDSNGIPKRGFFVVLNETDSLAVLKEEVIRFYEEKPSTNGYDKAKPAEYRRTKDVYYYRQGKHVSVLPQKRKDFIKLFPEHSKDLEIFIKKNKINLKEDEDLITLFQYLETL